MKLNLSRLLPLGSGARASDPLSLDTAIIDGPTSMTPGPLRSAVPGQLIQPSGSARVEVRQPLPERPPPSPVRSGGRLTVPFIGHLSLRRQLALLFPMLAVSLLLAGLCIWMDANRTLSLGMQNRLLGDSLMHSQRLARVAPMAARGQPDALRHFGESRKRLADSVALLKSGGMVFDRRMEPVDESLAPRLKSVEDLWLSTERSAQLLLAQQAVLARNAGAMSSLMTELPALADRAEQVSQLLGGPGIPASESLAAARLFAVSERMAREVIQLTQLAGPTAERALALRSDAASFASALDSLLNALEVRRSGAPRDVETRTRLVELKSAYSRLSSPLASLLESLPGLQAARAAEQRLSGDNEPLRIALEELNAYLLDAQTGTSWMRIATAVLLAISAISVLAMGLVYFQDVARRAREADAQRVQAERLEKEAKRTNDQNQAAILRLMNELQEVADGNLTVQATVSEDITGAIADSVNYTVEELRNLVARINATAGLVNEASTRAQTISGNLQATMEQQSTQIRQTGESVLDMANQIQAVTGHASESALVARQSLAAAEQGRQAVEKAIAGMDGIRDHIQETAKRIKRLGESSQEIGEIVELISDITEQTNVLALNAAIQAASAGEAGRGFTVVAEEVQRLAERSTQATRQIAGLIRTIQIDTQDAVAAMERSTQGVVAGTRLSDDTGNALDEIGRVSRHLAELIEGIAHTSATQAESAGDVARSIGRILQFTEQTGQGTQQTAASILQLATLARELQLSVSRFRVSS
jgi:twitching motility protein PilJ